MTQIVYIFVVFNKCSNLNKMRLNKRVDNVFRVSKYFLSVFKGNSLMIRLWIYFLFYLFYIENTFAQPIVNLSDVLFEAFKNNPELAVYQARVDAEEAAIASKYSLSDPRFGVMNESNITSDQRQMGDMSSWIISQEIMFPTKYFYMGSMQRSKIEALKSEYLEKKLEIRQKVITQFYNYNSSFQIFSLLLAQRETLREIARIVETRRSLGVVPQQDEMKAHVEQTRIENEILLQNQELIEWKSGLKSLLNREPHTFFEITIKELKVPKILDSLDHIEDLAHKSSNKILSDKAWLIESQKFRTLSQMNYFPNFMLSYRKPFGNSVPQDAYAWSIELSIPLWFFAKQNSEISFASFKVMEAEKRLEQSKREVESEVVSLKYKVETLAKLIRIYETALIPQSTSTLNSSRSAYSTGKIGFQELLDAERSLYSVRIDYYRNIAKFVEALMALERHVGQIFSDLPMGDVNH